MICAMSLRMISLVVVAALAAGCGAPPRSSDEPTTARDKQQRDAEASGAADAPSAGHSGWRYTGDRNDCFFVLGHRCFKTEEAACAAARCRTRCEVTGGGPAQLACAK
jgi:hypothetical protein